MINLGSDSDNPLGLLTDRHRRIARFLELLAKVVRERERKELDAEDRQALEVFTSLLPRVRSVEVFDVKSEEFPTIHS